MSGALTGTVADQSRAAVPDAAITVVGSSTGQSRVAVSGLDGGYLVSGLIPGEFDVRIEVNGFRTLTRKGVRVAAGETVRLDVVLTVGAVSEEVSVLGDGSQLRSATASLGQVLDKQMVVALPLNGRTFITLAGLAPGVALPPDSVLPRINGGRPRANE